MNLYIIKEVLFDYTSGMVVIAASSKERCREIFLAKFGEHHDVEFDQYALFTTIVGVNQSEGVVSYVHGGG